MIAIPLEDHLPQGHMAVWVRDIVFELMRKDLLTWREESEGRDLPSIQP